MNSVCMAVYNGEKYIQAQIESILAEIGADDELVISDDGSDDRTCDIIEGFGDTRIRLLHKNGHDFKANFEHALRAARGEIIFLADQDDVWLTGKYRACVAALDAGADLVVTDSRMVNERLEVMEPSFFAFYHSGPGILKNAVNNTYFGACMAMKRRIVEAALPLPRTREVGHDIWLGLVGEMVGKVVFLNEPYLLYRRHEAALTQLTGGNLLTRSKRSLWRKLWGRVIVLHEVGKFYFGKRRRL